MTRRMQRAAHDHGTVLDNEPDVDGPPRALVELAMAVQAGCAECAATHARQAAVGGANRQEVLEALGTALLLGRERAPQWARLAESALQAHEERVLASTA